MLAYGSNAAPRVLSRKLALSDQPVLVVPARLREFDVVYSSHLSPYGALPATLQRSPGTEVRVHVIYMTDAQIGVISATEPNYEPQLLEDIECRLEDGEGLSQVSAYISRHGCLLIDDSEVALAAVAASGRRLNAISEPEAIEWVRSSLCPDDSLESFVLANVTDPALSQARSAQLPARALRAR